MCEKFKDNRLNGSVCHVRRKTEKPIVELKAMTLKQNNKIYNTTHNNKNLILLAVWIAIRQQ